MTDDAVLKQLERSYGATVGDRIHVVVDRDGERVCYRGILLPHHRFSAPEVFTLKLDNGYNIGIELCDDLSIEVLERGPPANGPPVIRSSGAAGLDPGLELGPSPRPPDGSPVALLGVGGTIASSLEYRTGAVRPTRSTAELLAALPLEDARERICARVLSDRFGEDVDCALWTRLANAVAEEIDSGVSGVIVTHGTDTLAYTAAALSFLLRDLPSPVILVGAQRSADRPSSDAALNLRAALTVAETANLGEVVVAMHGGLSDTTVALHRGTRVRKMHSSRRDAFSTIGAEPLGRVEEGRVRLSEQCRTRAAGPVRVSSALEPAVALLWSYPGLDIAQFNALASHNRAIVVAGTGLGHVPTALIPAIRAYIENGGSVVMTSGCLFGRVDLRVYATGRKLLEAGVIPGGDMLPSTAYVKLMWALAQVKENDRELLEQMMCTPVVGECTERSTCRSRGAQR